MKRVGVFSLLVFLVSCTTTKYIPVESTHTEYKNTHTSEIIHLYDSIYVSDKADTFLIEKYRYIYKDRIVSDTLLRCDTITVVQHTETNTVSGFQWFQIWTGRLLFLVLLCYFVFKLVFRF